MANKPLVRTPLGVLKMLIGKNGMGSQLDCIFSWSAVFFLPFCLPCPQDGFFEKMGWDGNFIGKIGMGRKKLEIQLENMGWGDSWIPSCLGLLGCVCL